ncbi:23628_t:CDS:2, partial [Dentiscutata erythropus]
MKTIKYSSNKHLEIVSKTALKDHNKGQLEAVLINLSWKSIWNNSIAPAAKEIAREYRSKIKIKVKKALTEVFSRKRFPPIEEAHPSVDQINVWKFKDTIQVCFVDLESPKNPDNPNFTWWLAVLEQVYPEETTKNNIVFAS